MGLIDKAKADRAVNFIQRLKHTKGRFYGVPFLLEDFQEKVIRDIFGTVKADGTRQYRTVYIEVPRKNGKALAVDTQIPTSNGWMSMGDISVGDIVFDENGKQCDVVRVSDIMHDRPCYSVVFSDGTNIIADEQHEWKTQSRRTGRPHGKLFRDGEDIHTTQYLSNTISVDSPSNRGKVEWNHRISMNGAVEYPYVELPIAPYTLGCWIGDGVSANASVICSYSDMDIIDNIEADGYAIKEWKSSNENSGQFSIGSNGRSQKQRDNSLAAKLSAMGLKGNKHIPCQYLVSSIGQRIELLRGLMDTDGYCGRDGRAEYTTISGVIADGVVELVRSLGYKSKKLEYRATLYGRDCGPKYRIAFSPKSDVKVFKLRRKYERQKPLKKTTRTNVKQIVCVEPVDSVPVRCIQVNSLSQLYLAGDGFTATHNSELGAAIADTLLYADDEMGAEIYGAAAERDQASIVFDVAAEMVRQSPGLSRRSKIVESTKRIIYSDKASFYRVLSSEHSSKHGFNAHGVIFDELHVQPNRKLWDVLTSSGGTRSQPMVVALTTAGYDRNSICWEMHKYAEDIISGAKVDPSFYPVIFAADMDDDWTDEAIWHKANPALNTFRSIDEMREKFVMAKNIPAYQNTFRRLYLNQWTSQEERWLDMSAWDECAGEVNEEDLAGSDAYGGLDLASTTDIAAFVLVLPDAAGNMDVIARFFVPEENIDAREAKDSVPYRLWVEQGLIEATPGNVIDYRYIRKRINELGEIYHIKEIAFDRWGATEIIQNLGDDGFEVIQFGQGFASMAHPTRELLKLAVGGNLRHGGNPVLRWMADNMVVKQDPAGNVKPDKSKSSEKIDGMVALVMGLDRALRHEGGSVYDDRGMLTI